MKGGWGEWEFRRVYSNIKTQYLAFYLSFDITNFLWTLRKTAACSDISQMHKHKLTWSHFLKLSPTKTRQTHNFYLEVSLLISFFCLFLLEWTRIYTSFWIIYLFAEGDFILCFYFYCTFLLLALVFLTEYSCIAHGSSRKTGIFVKNPVQLVSVSLSDIIYEFLWLRTSAEWLKWKYDSTSPPSTSPPFTLTHCSGNIWQNNIKPLMHSNCGSP